MSIEHPHASNDNHAKPKSKLDESLDRLGKLVYERAAKLASGEISPEPEDSPKKLADDIWGYAQAKAGSEGEGNVLETIYTIAINSIPSFYINVTVDGTEEEKEKRRSEIRGEIKREIDNIYEHEKNRRK